MHINIFYTTASYNTIFAIPINSYTVKGAFNIRYNTFSRMTAECSKNRAQDKTHIINIVIMRQASREMICLCKTTLRASNIWWITAFIMRWKVYVCIGLM